MMTIFYILLIIVTVIAFLGFIAPKTYHVSRSVIINRPKTEVYEFIKYLKNQDVWSPWNKKDPDMKKIHKGTDGEIGFVIAWSGNKEVGEGEQEIINYVDGELIQTKLRFLKPFKSESDAYIRVEAIDAESTKVTWGFSGNNKFPFSIFMLFMNMDKAAGKDFEEGLYSLKTYLENKA